jgi:hypothetical protein
MTRTPSARVAAAIAAFAFAAAAAFAQDGAAYSFAVIGDTPYSRSQDWKFLELIDNLNREPLAFVVHIGDFKSGSSPCDDATYAERRRWFDGSAHPLVYTPGDNEWTDCYRKRAGGLDPLLQLDKLRTVFGHREAESLGRRRIALERQAQAGYPENARWRHRNALFATLNVQGSNNGYALADSPYREATDAEFARRSAANHAWMREAARLAAADSSIGIVFFAMQGDPLEGTSGFAGFLDTLRAVARDLPKPIVVIHGDTHIFRYDQPFRDPASGARIANLWRIETWGDPWTGWVKVTVSADLPPKLAVEQFIVP